eukprot:4181162-Amphidinium_carterae.1
MVKVWLQEGEVVPLAAARDPGCCGERSIRICGHGVTNTYCPSTGEQNVCRAPLPLYCRFRGAISLMTFRQWNLMPRVIQRKWR